MTVRDIGWACVGFWICIAMWIFALWWHDQKSGIKQVEEIAGRLSMIEQDKRR